MAEAVLPELYNIRKIVIQKKAAAACRYLNHSADYDQNPFGRRDNRFGLAKKVESNIRSSGMITSVGR
ncbi:hypothetical protein [Blautia pseudococcoides]|uniref:hypothetical protein n=1 Tax=Blautia pseudococcoides TaxID=1796616 RepID=UPI0012F51833|nr:hypothetical protein [Blautia pseudococcoides]QQQ95651.1 hypothetical protein I5Q86_03680 [Blautia pseudococcoides]